MPRKPLSLVLDFDGTITSQDTIGFLGSTGQQFQEQHGISPKPSWPQIVDAYSHDYMRYTSGYQPQPEQRQTIEAELEFLRSLQVVEKPSLQRVEESGLFRGMSEETLSAAGAKRVESGEVALRDGVERLLSAATQNGWQVAVLSVNWSRSFIRGVMGEIAPKDIIANEVQLDGTISGPNTTGREDDEPSPPMTTCLDKYTALRAFLQREGLSSEQLVYFGDSTSDVECLLLNRGVVMATDSESKLIKCLERVGFEVPPAGKAPPESKLVWARTFHEVLDQDSFQL